MAEKKCKEKSAVAFYAVCSICNRIRNENNIWKTDKKNVLKNPGTILSHGLCPACMTRHYADIV